MTQNRAPAKDSRPKMPRKEYEKALRKLQVPFCQLQSWVKEKGLRAAKAQTG